MRGHRLKNAVICQYICINTRFAVSLQKRRKQDMELYPKLIMDALATVRYPGTGRNVVEMKMVEDDLRISGMHVSFTLIFDKPTDPFLKSLVKACEAAIHAYVSRRHR